MRVSIGCNMRGCAEAARGLEGKEVDVKAVFREIKSEGAFVKSQASS